MPAPTLDMHTPACWESMPTDFGHWLAGFADGEGCFYVKRVTGRYLICAFTLALRLDDNAILDEIQSETGLGTIHITRRAKWGSNDQAVWNVRKKDDVLELVRIFERYPLRAKKARDFAIWREAAAVWGAGTSSDQRLWDIKSRLEQGRVYETDSTTSPVSSAAV